ncbi:hypothetical protein C8R45DRAFT_526237 [Mycena sanguinolenta]|nr:hypothetical protein C8R45DRAFT_526237 [Mycena sanguinolenta]
MHSVDPLLPPELERKIFETAAEAHPETISSMLLVAARVHEWIEPLKYRTFILTRPPSICPRFRALRQAVESKPAQFIRDNVWHLFIDRDVDQQTLDVFLPFCTAVQSLVIFNFHRQMVLHMLSQLESARPRRLAAAIGFVGRAQAGNPTAVDLTHSMFSSLTHLDVFEDIIAVTPSWSSLALLPGPALTHLAFLELSYNTAVAILGMCRKLQVIVSMESEEPTEWPTLSTTVDDLEPRSVGMALKTRNYASDWETGVRGGSDFWARADAFVAMRRRGEIEPKLRYWIEDGDGI